MIHKAKKSLGQNFLHSKGALRSIIQAANLHEGELVLEIGPGKGALTEALLATGARVIAVEKDDGLFEYLQTTFRDEIYKKKLDLIHNDITEFDPHFHKLTTGTYKLIANIPYNLTGLIIRTFLSGDTQPSHMVLLVQKEVAERIVARDKKESLLSLSVKLYGTPRYVSKVPAKFFRPMPKVDSAIISIENIGRAKLNNKEEEIFFNLIHAGFAHKRKMLLGNLSDHFPKSALIEAFTALSINEKSRAEDIPIDTWIAFAKLLSQKS